MKNRICLSFALMTFAIMSIISCSDFRDLSYRLSNPYCRNIAKSKGVAISCNVAVKSASRASGDGEQSLYFVNSDNSLMPFIFNFDIVTENDSLRNAFNRWIKTEMKITCKDKAIFAEDFLYLKNVSVSGGNDIVNEGNDKLSQVIFEAKLEAISKVDQKNLLVNLTDGAVFDLFELNNRFPDIETIKQNQGIFRANDGKSWYFLTPTGNTICKMQRNGDRLVVSDVNHSFLPVYDFVLDKNENICAMDSSGWTNGAVLFFADGSLDNWPKSRLEKYPSEAIFSLDGQWYTVHNYAYGSPYYEYETALSKVWIENKELKFKELWSKEDGMIEKYQIFPVLNSDDEYYVLGRKGRLKINKSTDVCTYEEYPASFPDNFSRAAWTVKSGWGLIPKEESISGVIERVGFDAYNIYTFEHFYIPIPGGAGNIKGYEKGSDIVYMEGSRWNEATSSYDTWIIKVDIRHQSATVFNDDISDVLFY